MIGELKHRVTLQKSILAPDGAGGFAESWQDVAEVYAALMPLAGSEQLQAHQLATTVTHRIMIRFRSDITPANRVMKDGVVYDIASVLDRDGVYLEIFWQS